MSKPHIAQFELENFFFLRDFVRLNQIPCDFEAVGAVCSLDTEAAAQAAKENVRLIRRNHPSLADKALYVEDKNELKRLRVPGACAAVVHPNAAKLWPYKLVAWVLERLLREYNTRNKTATTKFNLQTTTPVVHLQKYKQSWVVHTPRGQVVAKEVLLATNGYTSHLLPAMTDLISPTRGQINALLPPEGSTPLEHTHIWSSAAGASDYLIQRDGGDGLLILGGERAGPTAPQGRTSRDDVTDPQVSKQLREACYKALELRPGQKGGEAKELRAEYEWTGIMGDSRDQHPWVGKVPASLGGGEGLYIAAGYTGHGMPAASQSGMAVANMILGRGTGDVKLPPEFDVSEQRAQEAARTVLPQTMEEEIRMNSFWLQRE